LEETEKKKYADDGSLIVSELGHCAFFEKDSSCERLCGGEDCFFCKFSDFRKRKYIEKVNRENHLGILYSLCHNEKNNKNKSTT
jgi:hypothetical protein